MTILDKLAWCEWFSTAWNIKVVYLENMLEVCWFTQQWYTIVDPDFNLTSSMWLFPFTLLVLAIFETKLLDKYCVIYGHI